MPSKSNQKSDRASCRNCKRSQKTGSRVVKYDIFGSLDCTMYQQSKIELKLFIFSYF